MLNGEMGGDRAWPGTAVVRGEALRDGRERVADEPPVVMAVTVVLALESGDGFSPCMEQAGSGDDTVDLS